MPQTPSTSSKRMRMMLCALSVLAFSAIGSQGYAEVSSAKTIGSQNISVAVFGFNCSNFDGRVSYFFFGEPAGSAHHLTLQKGFNGAYHLALAKPPGHYQLWIESIRSAPADSIPCQTQEWFTVIPGHPRHLVMILGVGFTPHSNCSVAGALPADGFGISLILPKGHLVANTVAGGWLGPAQEDIDQGAVMDGSAFYVEHVAQGNYVLQFGSAEIPITVTNSGAPNSPYCQGEFIHNITKQELERAFPASMVTE